MAEAPEIPEGGPRVFNIIRVAFHCRNLSRRLRFLTLCLSRLTLETNRQLCYDSSAVYRLCS
jgi:hypothetical protein